MLFSQDDLSSPIRNRNLFSGYWLENRFPKEPEWRECAEAATTALEKLIILWKTERDRVDKYGNEQGLEYAFIQPVLEVIGWKLKYQTFLQGREPDYALFLSDVHLDAALNVDHKSAKFWEPVAVVADAKRWDLPLDKKLGASGKKEYPPEQIEWYLDRSRKPFGIITNGRLWRLIPRECGPHQRRYQTFYEIDLVAILNDAVDHSSLFYVVSENFLRFYLIFGTTGFAETDDRKSLTQRAVDGSSEYRLGVSEGLKEKTFEALRLCIEGFLAFRPNQLHPEKDLEECRENGFILLCRLLFILYAEDRRLLPYKTNTTYTNNRSLAKLRDDVAVRHDKVLRAQKDDFSRKETHLWDYLMDLFDLIDRGHATYKVPAYNGGLFDSENRPFLASKKIADWHLAKVIDSLSRAHDPQAPGMSQYRVDYRDLAIQHLGGIYEGLLEHHPMLAAVKMLLFTRSHKGIIEEKYVPETETPPAGFTPKEVEFPPGSVYLVKNKDERRTFGSYYTPDHIVDYIIRQTIRPLVDSITATIKEEIDAAQSKNASTEEIERLQSDFPSRIMKLRILDPSMGSGHFLLATCQYLAEELATNPYTPPGPDTSTSEDALTYWKRRVVENCLYGVDLNPLAVDLAKLALWLETVAWNQPLTFLDHHLQHGNSLMGGRTRSLGSLHQPKSSTTPLSEEVLKKKLPLILAPLAEIRDLPSDTVGDMKDKANRFKTYKRAVESLWRLADLWTVAAAGRDVDSDNYVLAVQSVSKPSTFKHITAEVWFQSAVASADDLHAFHWELAFPEVFCDANGVRGDGGFDTIIGNPPYEVLAEEESGTDWTSLRGFVDSVPQYAPAMNGKQNLYKLFICRSLDLLRPGGRFGFIVPMALLGDKIASDLRRYMVKVGEFVAVEGFPQKDDPKKRVFPDAKLSTSVFVFANECNRTSPRRFASRLHSGGTVEVDSPSLELSAPEIPLYDPANFTIACCPQADWDLAVRVMKTGRMKRLREFAEFSQGEVNETNEKKKPGTLVAPGKGKLVIRGASICLYVAREASQGDDLYLNVPAFTAGKGEGTKAFDHLHRRVVWQESSPQNNFRRIIAALLPAGEFCNHKVNYLTERKSNLPLPFVLGLLNSLLADWYFRLGSTNASVSHYQIENLPCPLFQERLGTKDETINKETAKLLAADKPAQTLALLRPLIEVTPFSIALRDAIEMAVKRIIDLEKDRGEMSRSDRSSLSLDAQPFQDFIDTLLFNMAGLTEKEVEGLRKRYQKMKEIK